MTRIIALGLTDKQVKRARSAAGGNGALVVWEENAVTDEVALSLVREEPAAILIGAALPNGDDRSTTAPDPFSERGAERAFDLASRLEALDPAIAKVLMVRPDADHLRRAMAIGVREVLSPDADRADVRAVLDRARSAGMRMRAARAPANEAPAHRFVVVTSAKGGVGKTIISTNLASLISKASTRRTALIDLDLQFGDVATALMLSPTYTIADAANAGDALDTAALKVFLTPHTASGLHVLCAPDDPAIGESLPAARISGMFDLLAAEFGHVVVDTDPGLSESTLTALERATDIVVVADLDVPSVRGTRKLLETLDVIGFGQARRVVVLNRADSRVGLTADEAAAAIGCRVDVSLPSSRSVPISMNEGRPLGLTDPRSPFGRQMTGLAATLMPALAPNGGLR